MFPARYLNEQEKSYFIDRWIGEKSKCPADRILILKGEGISEIIVRNISDDKQYDIKIGVSYATQVTSMGLQEAAKSAWLLQQTPAEKILEAGKRYRRQIKSAKVEIKSERIYSYIKSVVGSRLDRTEICYDLNYLDHGGRACKIPFILGDRSDAATIFSGMMSAQGAIRESLELGLKVDPVTLKAFATHPDQEKIKGLIEWLKENPVAREIKGEGNVLSVNRWLQTEIPDKFQIWQTPIEAIEINAGQIFSRVRLSSKISFDVNRILFNDQELPHSVLASLQGKPLGTLIEHPLLDPNAKITSVVDRKGITDVRFYYRYNRIKI